MGGLCVCVRFVCVFCVCVVVFLRPPFSNLKGKSKGHPRPLLERLYCLQAMETAFLQVCGTQFKEGCPTKGDSSENGWVVNPGGCLCSLGQEVQPGRERQGEEAEAEVGGDGRNHGASPHKH